MIAAASPHRADAFAACRYAIERVKQIAPIWKHEHFEGGDVWIEGATADPDGRGRARQMAFAAHARNDPAVRPAARAGRRGGAARASCPTGRPRGRLARRWSREFPGARATTTRAISCAVNDEYARLTTPLNDGDEVAFLPPVSGG